MCYYFQTIIKTEDFYFDNIFQTKTSFENILLYGILHKIFIGAKPLSIMFDRFVRDHDGARYLVLLFSEKYDSIFDRVRYLIG